MQIIASNLVLLPLLLSAPQSDFAAVRVPVVNPAAASMSGCEPRIAINAINTPGDADSQFRIPRPGSYYVPGNLTGVAGKTCIEVASNDVEIDLMGFQLAGVPGSLNGIAVDGERERVTVRRGAVTGFGVDGVTLSPGRGSVIEHMRATGNGADGLAVPSSSRISACISLANGAAGILAGVSCVVSDSVSSQNVGYGFFISVSGRTDLCQAYQNGAHGFYLSNYSEASNCIANLNAGSGFHGGSSVRIEGSSAGHNQNGFRCQSTAAQILNCKAQSNEEFGFWTTHQSDVRGNLSASNGGLGVGGGYRVDGWHSVLERNHSVENDFNGFMVSQNGNFLRANTASNNGVNWSIAPGNVCHVMVAATGGAIFGNGGGLAAGAASDATTNWTF